MSFLMVGLAWSTMRKILANGPLENHMEVSNECTCIHRAGQRGSTFLLIKSCKILKKTGKSHLIWTFCLSQNKNETNQRRKQAMI
jgi:hypothetical protein